MTSPVALTRPDGSVHAYACGRCGMVGGGGTWRGPDSVTGLCCAHPDDARADAERCCICTTCGAVTETGAPWCAACEAKSRAERSAETARAVVSVAVMVAATVADEAARAAGE